MWHIIPPVHRKGYTPLASLLRSQGTNEPLYVLRSDLLLEIKFLNYEKILIEMFLYIHIQVNSKHGDVSKRLLSWITLEHSI